MQHPNPHQPQQQQQGGGQQGHSQGPRTQFKTAEGVYRVSHEKLHPSGFIQYSASRIATKITLATLDDKPASKPGGTPASSQSQSGSRFARGLLGSGSGSRGLGFGLGNGKAGSSKSQGGTPGGPSGSAQASRPNLAADGKDETELEYVIFNVGDFLFVADCNTVDKDPIKCIQFPGANGVCHAFDPMSKEGHDLVIGSSTGEIYTASLRQQLQDPGKKLCNATTYNKEGCVSSSRCMAVAWVPNSEGQFVAAHADGNMFVYEKGREGSAEVAFPPLKDQASLAVDRARNSKSNPIARWHLCSVPINALAFSPSGSHCATVGRDGILRVLDWDRQCLESGLKSYYGALLCCAFSADGKLVVAGGEDDLVHIWDREEQSTVGWCEGHSSWVTAVSFDSFWVAPPPLDASPESPPITAYRLGSVGQDTRFLQWEVSSEELAVPPRTTPTAAHLLLQPRSPPIADYASSSAAAAPGEPPSHGGAAAGGARGAAFASNQSSFPSQTGTGTERGSALQRGSQGAAQGGARSSSDAVPGSIKAGAGGTPSKASDNGPGSKSASQLSKDLGPKGGAAPGVRTSDAGSGSGGGKGTTAAVSRSSDPGAGHAKGGGAAVPRMSDSGATSSSSSGDIAPPLPAYSTPPESSASGSVSPSTGHHGQKGAGLTKSSASTINASGPAVTGRIYPPPSRLEVPKIPPLTAVRVHQEPLSSLAFSKSTVLTACQEGCVRIWLRPGVPPIAGSLAANGEQQEPNATVASRQHGQVDSSRLR